PREVSGFELDDDWRRMCTHLRMGGHIRVVIACLVYGLRNFIIPSSPAYCITSAETVQFHRSSLQVQQPSSLVRSKELDTHHETDFFHQRFSPWSCPTCCCVSAGVRRLRSGAADVEPHVS